MLKKLLALFLVACISTSLIACSTGDVEVSVEDDENGGETKVTDVEDEPAEDDKTDDEKQDEKTDEDEKSPFSFSVDEIEINGITPVESVEVDFDFETVDFEKIISQNLSVEDLAKVLLLPDSQKKMILEKKEEIIKKVVKLLKEKNLDVMIDAVTGEIILNSSILFGTDSAEVSDQGKELLQKFTEAYASVMCGREYSDFISKIIVEGHTDTDGDYEYNKKLSLERATNVMNVCLSDEVNISDEAREELKSCVEAAGCSYDRPIMDENGKVDMEASRRVTFRFMINIDSLIG